MARTEPLVYLDGNYLPKSEAKISVYDHGLLYGDGVFEGIRAFDGYVFMLKEHVDRLYQSASCIELAIPMSKDEVIDTVAETLRRNDYGSAYIRLVVTRGIGDMGVNPSLCKKSTIFVIAEPVSSATFPEEPRVVSTVISSVRRDSVDATSHEIKSLNYLNSIMAYMEANRAQVDFPIILDSRGFVSEGPTMNVFIVRDQTVVTPSTSAGILHGITRARLIKLCRELKLPIVERDITPFELTTADEAFFSGTLLGLAAIGEVNKRKIGSGRVGRVTKQLYDEFRDIVSRPEEGYPIFRTESDRALLRRQSRAPERRYSKTIE